MKCVHQIDSSKFILCNLQDCPNLYFQNPQRAGFFEIIWFKHSKEEDDHGNQYMYLVPLYRVETFDIQDKKGCIIAFKREYLEEDDKEFALDVFNLFNMQGQYTSFRLEPEVLETLQYVKVLMEREYKHPNGTYLVLKALLKVFLLNLIRMNQSYFLHQDVDQKRVYQFIMLMDKHYKVHRKTHFYSSEMGISEKRINQILKEKMNKTITQLLHDRVILEADRILTSGDMTIKEIAFYLNFDDPAYFSRFYKKQTGQTPEDFKKQIVN
ncbi:AraC family transcriptional regulator [Chryseobacterium phosphatilyticum]|uniref:AraC family transcriptional regulator n=1 Tax=Chryseobacterium phosphatilyticum TaxID=475075 RepID=A0A316X7E5_9FLAO|nr:helix-turn-helix domain-containing protein [Chryseobacterium phosphatilyticum]PWN69474.1 AraC family transcriptional regulator [Chryseobacterium phosphatilyticum]